VGTSRLPKKKKQKINPNWQRGGEMSTTMKHSVAIQKETPTTDDGTECFEVWLVDHGEKVDFFPLGD